MPSAEQSTTEIANLAISHCGISKPIANLATDKGIEAQLCRQFFNIARRSAIKDGRWMFAIKQISPALVANQPTPEWLYAYEYPSDCLKIFRFISWRLTNDTRQSRIPYTVMQPVSTALSTLTTPPTSYAESSGQWIYTNWPGVNGSAIPTILEYGFDNQNVNQWTDDFCFALSMKLATLIVTTLTTGDPMATKQKLQMDYESMISTAAAMDLNEEQRPQEPQAEWIRARDCESLDTVSGMSWIAEPSGFVVE